MIKTVMAICFVLMLMSMQSAQSQGLKSAESQVLDELSFPDVPSISAAIEQHPTNSSYYLIRSKLYKRDRKLVEALADYDKSVDLDRGGVSGAGCVYKGDLLYALGRFEQASEEYSHAISCFVEFGQEPAFIYEKKAQAEWKAGRRPAARAALERGCQLAMQCGDEALLKNIVVEQKEWGIVLSPQPPAREEVDKAIATIRHLDIAKKPLTSKILSEVAGFPVVVDGQAWDVRVPHHTWALEIYFESEQSETPGCGVLCVVMNKDQTCIFSSDITSVFGEPDSVSSGQKFDILEFKRSWGHVSFMFYTGGFKCLDKAIIEIEKISEP